MPRGTFIKTSFNAGEWSPLMEGHVNLERFNDSARTLQNMIPLKQGPVTRRGGTFFTKEVKDSTDDTLLFPFVYNIDQAYVIEAGDTYFRFFRSNAAITEAAQNITGITQANPAVLTYSGADNYANGNEVYISGVAGMTEVNGKWFRVANVNTGANTFELTDIDGNNINSTSYTAYSSGGTIAEHYEITSPYAKADLYDSDGRPNLQFAQSANVAFIVNGASTYEVRSLRRDGHTDWTLTTIDLNDGPYLDENGTATTLTLSGTTGSVTVTASATTGINNDTGFQTTDVGRLIRWKDSSNEWTWLEITARSSTTVVTATIKGQDAAATTATTNWRLGVFSDTTGWPQVITIYEERVLLAGCTTYPDFWALSRSGGYDDSKILFAPSDVDGTVTDDAGITGYLNTGGEKNRVDRIVSAGNDDRGLILITEAREWLVRPTDNGETLTPSNKNVRRLSSIGGAYGQPVGAETGLVYIQNAGKKVHDIIYNFEQDKPKPRDLTIPSDHITRAGVLQLAFQQEPLNVIWAVRADGTLLSLTYYPDEAVFAFASHPLGGTDVAVKCLTVIPSADGTRDELWMIVERTINSTTRKYIEYMTRYYEDDMALDDTICMDSALTYDSTATATVSGLEHLEGETVKAMVDGKSHPDLTVTNGAVTLANSRTGSTIQIGLGNTWAVKPQRPDVGGRDGTSLGKAKRITLVVLQLLNTLGLKYGTSASDAVEYDFDQGTSFGETPTLFSGYTEDLHLDADYTADGDMFFTGDDVFPATILGFTGDAATNERG